ncbi:unnamed protein product, partial [Mesorhabditis spiculigera]
MPFNLGDTFPDFACETDEGPITSIHEWMEDKWLLLFSHPADFTPVCTTELAMISKAGPHFAHLGVKLMALSVDGAASHADWKKDIQAVANIPSIPFPIIADEKRDLAVLLGMMDPEERDAQGMAVTCRAVFLVDHEKKVKFVMLYPATTGRSIEELYRVTASIRLTSQHPLATPMNWTPYGDKVMVQPTLPLDEAKKRYPSITVKEVPSGKQYIRMVDMPEEYVLKNKVSADVCNGKCPKKG